MNLYIKIVICGKGLRSLSEVGDCHFALTCVVKEARLVEYYVEPTRAAALVTETFHESH